MPALLCLVTFVNSQSVKYFNAIASLPKKHYLCTGNGRKGPKSRMSDECLMKQETVSLFYTQYQAVMRKFTLAGKSCAKLEKHFISTKLGQAQGSDAYKWYTFLSSDVNNLVGFGFL